MFTVAWEALGRSFAKCDNWTGLRDLIEKLPDSAAMCSVRAILSALEFENKGDLLAAQNTLETAWNQTQDSVCLDELCRMLTQKGYYENALPKLELLCLARPDDPSVRHNLGITLHLCGRTAEAVQTMLKSLEIDPSRITTRCQLAGLYVESGDERSSLQLLRRSLDSFLIVQTSSKPYSVSSNK